MKNQRSIKEFVDYEHRYYNCKSILISLYGDVKGEKLFYEILSKSKNLSLTTGSLKIDTIEYLTNEHLK